MASLSEEVLLVVKKVRQRKQDGTLYLMAERIAWGPEGKDRFTVSHLYSDIRCESWVPFKQRAVLTWLHVKECLHVSLLHRSEDQS